MDEGSGHEGWGGGVQGWSGKEVEIGARSTDRDLSEAELCGKV